MLIALPNLDGSFTCTLFMPFEGENSFASLEDRGDVALFLKRTFQTLSSYSKFNRRFFKIQRAPW
jgi:kynurenine 3-monooxygenase